MILKNVKSFSAEKRNTFFFMFSGSRARGNGRRVGDLR